MSEEVVDKTQLVDLARQTYSDYNKKDVDKKVNQFNKECEEKGIEPNQTQAIEWFKNDKHTEDTIKEVNSRIEDDRVKLGNKTVKGLYLQKKSIEKPLVGGNGVVYFGTLKIDEMDLEDFIQPHIDILKWEVAEKAVENGLITPNKRCTEIRNYRDDAKSRIKMASAKLETSRLYKESPKKIRNKVIEHWEKLGYIKKNNKNELVMYSAVKLSKNINDKLALREKKRECETFSHLPVQNAITPLIFYDSLMISPQIKNVLSEEKLISKSIKEKFNYIIKAAEILHETSLYGGVHRDIKRGNLLATNNDLYIIDWGLGKGSESKSHESTQMTLESHILGTPSNISPQQYELSKETDIRNDIYSLTTVLYEYLTRRNATHNVPLKDENGKYLNNEAYVKRIYTYIGRLIDDPKKEYFPDAPYGKNINTNHILFLTKGMWPTTDKRFQNYTEMIQDLNSLIKNKKPEYTLKTLKSYPGSKERYIADVFQNFKERKSNKLLALAITAGIIAGSIGACYALEDQVPICKKVTENINQGIKYIKDLF